MYKTSFARLAVQPIERFNMYTFCGVIKVAALETAGATALLTRLVESIRCSKPVMKSAGSEAGDKVAGDSPWAFPVVVCHRCCAEDLGVDVGELRLPPLEPLDVGLCGW